MTGTPPAVAPPVVRPGQEAAALDAIAATICEAFHLHPLDLLADGRAGRDVAFSHPRFIAVWLARRWLRLPVVMIARRFGYADHTMVSYCVRRTMHLIDDDATLRHRIYSILVNWASRHHPVLLQDPGIAALAQSREFQMGSL